jgi:hypothetical protein
MEVAMPTDTIIAVSLIATPFVIFAAVLAFASITSGKLPERH